MVAAAGSTAAPRRPAAAGWQRGLQAGAPGCERRKGRLAVFLPSHASRRRRARHVSLPAASVHPRRAQHEVKLGPDICQGHTLRAEQPTVEIMYLKYQASPPCPAAAGLPCQALGRQ